MTIKRPSWQRLVTNVFGSEVDSTDLDSADLPRNFRGSLFTAVFAMLRTENEQEIRSEFFWVSKTESGKTLLHGSATLATCGIKGCLPNGIR